MSDRCTSSFWSSDCRRFRCVGAFTPSTLGLETDSRRVVHRGGVGYIPRLLLPLVSPPFLLRPLLEVSRRSPDCRRGPKGLQVSLEVWKGPNGSSPPPGHPVLEFRQPEDLSSVGRRGRTELRCQSPTRRSYPPSRTPQRVCGVWTGLRKSLVTLSSP